MQHKFIEPITCDKYDLLSREDAIELAKGYADAIKQLQNKLENKINSSFKVSRLIFY
jgi:hypothetical protein